MRSLIIATLTLLLFASSLCAQASQSFYAESFRKGPTHVTDLSFVAKVDPTNRTYREFIKDTRGSNRYTLSITPQGPVGDNTITSWEVKLADLHHPIYTNVLRASLEPSADPKNNLWWLNPSQFAPVPIRAKRIIKVDSFYVVLEVQAFHFTPLDSPYLDSLTVEVKVTNSDPRNDKP